MWSGFDVITTNIGIGFDTLLVLLAGLAGFIMAAKNFKFALLWWFMTFGGLFMWFYEWSQVDTTISFALPLVLFIMSLIVLSLSLWAIDRRAETGGFI